MQVSSASTCYFSSWRIHQLSWQFPLFQPHGKSIAVTRNTSLAMNVQLSAIICTVIIYQQHNTSSNQCDFYLFTVLVHWCHDWCWKCNMPNLALEYYESNFGLRPRQKSNTSNFRLNIISNICITEVSALLMSQMKVRSMISLQDFWKVSDKDKITQCYGTRTEWLHSFVNNYDWSLMYSCKSLLQHNVCFCYC